MPGGEPQLHRAAADSCPSGGELVAGDGRSAQRQGDLCGGEVRLRRVDQPTGRLQAARDPASGHQYTRIRRGPGEDGLQPQVLGECTQSGSAVARGSFGRLRLSAGGVVLAQQEGRTGGQQPALGYRAAHPEALELPLRQGRRLACLGQQAGGEHGFRPVLPGLRVETGGPAVPGPAVLRAVEPAQGLGHTTLPGEDPAQVRRRVRGTQRFTGPLEEPVCGGQLPGGSGEQALVGVDDGEVEQGHGLTKRVVEPAEAFEHVEVTLEGLGQPALQVQQVGALAGRTRAVDPVEVRRGRSEDADGGGGPAAVGKGRCESQARLRGVGVEPEPVGVRGSPSQVAHRGGRVPPRPAGAAQGEPGADPERRLGAARASTAEASRTAAAGRARRRRGRR